MNQKLLEALKQDFVQYVLNDPFVSKDLKTHADKVDAFKSFANEVGEQDNMLNLANFAVENADSIVLSLESE